MSNCNTTDLTSPAPYVCAFAHDPSGGNVVGAVVAVLRERGVPVILYAKGPAAVALSRQGQTFCPVANEPDSSQTSASDLAQISASLSKAALVVSGTSELDDLEQRAWLMAEAAGVSRLVISDFWTNHVVRFADRVNGGGRMLIPQVVTALDELCRQALIADGIPSDRIVITGHPNYARLIRQGALEGRPATARRRILFASQQIPPERLALEMVAEACTLVRSNVASLDVRMHPRATNRDEVRGWLRPFALSGGPQAPGDLQTALAGADLVLGMNSAVLIEAALMGRPVGRVAIEGIFPLPASLDSVVVPLSDLAGITRFIVGSLSVSADAQEFYAAHQDADRRIADLCLGMMLEG